MKNAHLIHNPKAGDQDHLKAELIRRVESLGFTCQYTSIKKKGWKRLTKDTDLVVIVGGDGTVREVLKEILHRSLLDKPMTVALMPSGTANNFAKSLGISPGLEAFERCITAWKPTHVDVGVINHLPEADFFIEGLGCGLIPKLIKKMKGADSGKLTAGEELDQALAELLKITKAAPATRAVVTIDGQVYENDYLLVEVLNIRSVGPNLILAPEADPTDGKFEVVLLKYSERELFSTYLRQSQQNALVPSPTVPWQIVTAAHEVVIECDNHTIHVDDELVTHKKAKKIGVTIRPNIVEIIT